MTFILRSDVKPSVNTLPKFDFINVDLKSILTPGSLILSTPDTLLEFAGKGAADFASGTNLAESLFKSTYNTTDDAKLWMTSLTDKTLNSYITLSEQNGGLKFHCDRTQVTPATAMVARLKLMSQSNFIKILSTNKDIYFDAWIEVLNDPVLLGNTSKDWTEVAGIRIAISDSPTSKPSDRISLNSQNLQKTTQDKKLIVQPIPSLITNTDLIQTSYVLNEKQMVCSAGTLPSGSTNTVAMVFASILEGGYMAQDFILYSLYMEDLTVSGRTANQVAQFRKKQFEKFFS